MILLSQSVLRDCCAVFRRAVPKSAMARSATNVHVLGGRDGIRLRLMQTEVAIEYHHATVAESFSFAIAMNALIECEGRGNGTVEFIPQKNDKIELRWEQAGNPCRREYPLREPTPMPNIAWSGRDTPNDPSLLEALANAMQIPTGSVGRLSLTHIQLRGKQGDIVATDGKQLLIQGGFQFPWKDAVLVPRTSIFAARELPQGEAVRVAQSKTHVFVRIGGWTIAFAMQPSTTRFPQVDQVIPKANLVTSRWRIGDDEAPALAAMLENLPAFKEDHAPVTLDLAKQVVVRARAEDEKRCSEVVLPRSQVEGKPVRLIVDRRFLRSALELGFRVIQITAADKALLCQDGQRLYVWVPLDSKSALAPQPGALRVMLPGVADKPRRMVATREPIKRPASMAPAARSARRNRVLNTFFTCAQALWCLVGKHREKERAA